MACNKHTGIEPTSSEVCPTGQCHASCTSTGQWAGALDLGARGLVSDDTYSWFYVNIDPFILNRNSQ